MQLLNRIQGSGERSGRAAMLRARMFRLCLLLPWPHLLLLGHACNTVPFAGGLKLSLWLCTVCHVFPTFLFLAKHFSASFPFLGFERKVVAALPLKREAASFSRAAAICFFHRVMGRNGIWLSGHLRNHCSQADSSKNTFGFWMAGYLRGSSFLSFLQFILCASLPQF